MHKVIKNQRAFIAKNKPLIKQSSYNVMILRMRLIKELAQHKRSEDDK